MMSEGQKDVAELSDEELMLRYSREGDLQAFEVIVCRHEKPLYNFILRTVKNEAVAQDILQETFVALVRKAADYEPTAKLTTYMYTIARNRCIDFFRKKRPDRSLDAPLGAGEDDATTLGARIADETLAPSDVETDKKRFQRALSVALDTLPDDQRKTFMLKEVSGLKFREIAELEGISVGTAKSRMRLAVEKLQHELGDFSDSPIKAS